jgi:signal peptide peptidase SppA
LKLPRIWSRMTSTPWAIQPNALEEIIAIAERKNESPEAVAARLGRALDNTQVTEIRNGVAILPVSGPLFRYANLFTSISGASSYDVLAQDFIAAVENTDVKAILLNVDSPGGDANGCSEFADMIYAAREKKAIFAYIGGDGCSAAYWIASAAQEIVVSDTAMVGSIGVVVGITDRKDADAKNGIKNYEIVSTQSPYKRVDPGTDVGRSKIQQTIDALADVFVGKVARNRGVSSEKVLSDFGQGGTFIGQAAVAAGMADRLGTFEGVLAEMASGKSIASVGMRSPVAAEKIATKEVIKMDAKKLREEYPALVEKIEAEAKASVQLPDVDAACISAAAQERDRVFGIIGCDAAKGREALALALAKKPGMASEDAQEILAASPVDLQKGASFESVMAQLNPKVSPDSGEPADPEKSYLETSTKLGAQFGIV